MSTQSISESVLAAFREYVSSRPPEEIFEANGGQEPTTLAEYIRAWVGWDGAVHACCGDFHAYLIGVIAIINEWMVSPGLLDYAGARSGDPRGDISRSVTSIFGDGVVHLDDILDSDFFGEATFRTLHPRHR